MINFFTPVFVFLQNTVLATNVWFISFFGCVLVFAAFYLIRRLLK